MHALAPLSMNIPYFDLDHHIHTNALAAARLFATVQRILPNIGTRRNFGDDPVENQTVFWM